MSIVDLDQVEGDPFNGVHYDYCICGAGPAGITVARKLAEKYRVCLLEAGGMSYRPESQDPYKGTSTGKSYFPLDACRLRYFGGASGHWGGVCRPLDEEDFKKKDFVEYSGWPIHKSDLDPYLDEAKDILDVPREDTLDPAPCDERWMPKFPEYRETRFWMSKPTRFGEKYADEISRHANIDCYLNANVTDIHLSDDHQRTLYYEVKNYSMKRFEVHAGRFILATGGLENARILLNANKQMVTGIGNQNDLVGRFFTDHPHQHLGEYILEDDIARECENDTVYWKGPPDAAALQGHFFKPTVGFEMSNHKLNFALSIAPGSTRPNHHDSGFKSKLRAAICSSELLRESAEWVKDGSVTCFDVDGYIRIQSEQEPNPESRLTVTDQKDAFGLPRLNMHWQFTDLDRETIRDAAYRVAERFATSGVGRVRLERWLRRERISLPGTNDHTPSIVAGPHHMCTTRMSDSPKTGVVDRNCKVFGIDNLYIAGSSVFSTGGFSNPTFSIVQLSLRLAEHLKSLHG